MMKEFLEDEFNRRIDNVYYLSFIAIIQIGNWKDIQTPIISKGIEKSGLQLI